MISTWARVDFNAGFWKFPPSFTRKPVAYQTKSEIFISRVANVTDWKENLAKCQPDFITHEDYILRNLLSACDSQNGLRFGYSCKQIDFGLNVKSIFINLPMTSTRINVLESYDFKFCCVCTQNSESFYLNIFENVIVYRSAYVPLSQILEETLGIQVRKSISIISFLVIWHNYHVLDSAAVDRSPGYLHKLQNQSRRFLHFQATEWRSSKDLQRINSFEASKKYAVGSSWPDR